MIDIITVVKRDWFWRGTTKEEYVEAYRKNLLEAKENLKNCLYTYLFPISDKYMAQLKEGIEHEINLCDFFNWYAKRREKPDFNKWVFKTREQMLKRGMDKWRVGGDRHTIDNGKIRVTIEVEDKISSIKVSMLVENSAEHLKFFEENEKTLDYSRVFKKESAKKRVEEYKTRAYALFEKYKYPRYCREILEMETLNRLLWNGS